tara:strand:+ start:642 stop:785 length:144 start_codon:yes stop_codon:yes gene_type:complete
MKQHSHRGILLLMEQYGTLAGDLEEMPTRFPDLSGDWYFYPSLEPLF